MKFQFGKVWVAPDVLWIFMGSEVLTIREIRESFEPLFYLSLKNFKNQQKHQRIHFKLFKKRKSNFFTRKLSLQLSSK